MSSDQPADLEDETDDQKLTRNLNELLQELRVTQTGVQILTGFLLTLPFNHSARAGLVALAMTTSGVMWLVFDVVINRTLASVAGGLSLLFFAVLWAGVPLVSRNR